jgi:hypothetical protein
VGTAQLHTPTHVGRKVRTDAGRLFRVDSDGKPPLLFSKKDRKRKYVGLSEVHLPSFYAEQFGKVVASKANR